MHGVCRGLDFDLDLVTMVWTLMGGVTRRTYELKL